MDSRITLKNNEIKDIMKIIRFLKNREILLKETTWKIISREGRLFSFLDPLKKLTLPLMKNVLMPLAMNVLTPLGLTVAASATDGAAQKRIYGSEMATLITSN